MADLVMFAHSKDQMLRNMGIKPDNVKTANVIQGSKGRLMVELQYNDGQIKLWYFKGVPSGMTTPIPNTEYLKWILITREEFEAIGRS